MRGILYRAWDDVEKTMHYVHNISSFNGVLSSNGKGNRHDKHSRMTWDGYCYEEGKLQPYVLMLWTRSLDKNKLKIYEGDFIKIEDQAYLVVLRAGCFMADSCDSDKTLIWHEIASKKDMEIIGNKFEGIDSSVVNFRSRFLV